jgi:hypothetical protein
MGKRDREKIIKHLAHKFFNSSLLFYEVNGTPFQRLMNSRSIAYKIYKEMPITERKLLIKKIDKIK